FASIQKLSVWRVFDKRQRAGCAISLLSVAHQPFPANSSLRFAPSVQRAESQQPIRDERALLRHVLSELQSSKYLGIARILFDEINRPISEDTRYVCSTILLIYYKHIQFKHISIEFLVTCITENDSNVTKTFYLPFYVGSLSRIGGITLRKKVEGVLNRLMSIHLMSQMNYAGRRKEKVAFRQSPPYQIVIDSVMANDSNAQTSAIVEEI
ncbi:hypothetical protein CAPTEDRAFT_191468, partial [Capitella teleta]